MYTYTYLYMYVKMYVKTYMYLYMYMHGYGQGWCMADNVFTLQLGCEVLRPSGPLCHHGPRPLLGAAKSSSILTMQRFLGHSAN